MNNSDKINQYDKLIEELMEKPYGLIDIYPITIPEEKRDAYFEVERYFNQSLECQRFANKITRIILKALCYLDMEVCVNNRWLKEIKATELAMYIQSVLIAKSGYMNLLLTKENTLIHISSGDLYVTVYNPNEQVEHIFQMLVQSEGLFWRIEV